MYFLHLSVHKFLSILKTCTRIELQKVKNVTNPAYIIPATSTLKCTGKLIACTK